MVHFTFEGQAIAIFSTPLEQPCRSVHETSVVLGESFFSVFAKAANASSY
jgi:hypothetical protein